MMMLPEELIMLIKQNVNDYTSLTNLKMSCAFFNKVITQFSLARELVNDKFSKYECLSTCINADCYEDTVEIYENHYYDYNNRYVHYHQPALNNAKISICKKDYKVRSPYCVECFVKHVLIGDKTNVRRDFVEDEVIIDY